MKNFGIAGAAFAMAVASPAYAVDTTSYTFNTTGSTGVNGAYGNSLLFSSTTDPTLQLKVTGWQSSQLTNNIYSAYLGAYDGGLGVTGILDANGGNGYHQVDNANLLTDMVLLQFSRAVSLSGAFLNTYGMGGVSGHDSDLAYFDAGAYAPSTWNANVDLTAYRTDPSLWTTVNGNGSGYRTIDASTASTMWLVSAAFLPARDRDDGFKIASITVGEVTTPAVPEPATWASLIAGFGMIGTGLRYRRRRTATAYA